MITETWLWGTAIIAAVGLGLFIIGAGIIGDTFKSEGEARFLLASLATFLFSWAWIVLIPLALVVLIIGCVYMGLKNTIQQANVKDIWR